MYMMGKTFCCVLLAVFVTMPSSGVEARIYNSRPGYGYAGRIEAYRASPELKAKMAKFGMTAGRFVRQTVPDGYLRQLEKFTLNEIPYLLYAPKPGPKPVPMVVYFGGTGEQGEDLTCQFGQTTVFEKLTTPQFQKKYPCYIFAPLMPKGMTMRAALPGASSRLADLTCDAMYAVISSVGSPRVDTNRLYVTGLSWGGGAAFDLPCSYPGRFAASVPISSIQSPLRIPEKAPGNYWMIYNESAYGGDWSQKAIREMEEIVRARGGDFRRSTFPDIGHDAWRKAWREDAVWEWMFSKTLDTRKKSLLHGVSKPSKDSDGAFYHLLAKAKCSSSVPGKDSGHGPDRVVDGLDATAYVSESPVTKGDWLEIEFPESIKGKIRLCSGFRNGKSLLRSAFIETSSGDGRWRRVGAFSEKTGEASFAARFPVKRVRAVYGGTKPVTMVVRKIVVESL